MDKLLTIKDLSEWLQISPKTIYNWVHLEYIPCIKFKHAVRFNKETIVAWLNKKRRNGRYLYRIHIV